jgi:NAD-dependent deacetylase
LPEFPKSGNRVIERDRPLSNFGNYQILAISAISCEALPVSVVDFAFMLNVFVLTGAGISAESGIPVFQGTSWRGYSHYQLASIDAWRADPQLVWEYYSERRRRARDAKPNPAHLALAEFEQASAVEHCFVCTQNVDSLHEAAGSRELFHIHGKLFESRCAADCGRPVFADHESYLERELPRCSCGALVRPNVCWFGEQPYHLDRVFQELERCDHFLAIGTSGSVEPVSSFVALLKRRRDRDKHAAKTIYLGLAEPANAAYFDEVHLGPASSLVPRVLAAIQP